MTASETANIIQILRGLGWSGDQIADFQLGVAGNISVEQSIQNIKKEEAGER